MTNNIYELKLVYKIAPLNLVELIPNIDVDMSSSDQGFKTFIDYSIQKYSRTNQNFKKGNLYYEFFYFNNEKNSYANLLKMVKLAQLYGVPCNKETVDRLYVEINENYPEVLI
jgi:hypothetical protein